MLTVPLVDHFSELILNGISTGPPWTYVRKTDLYKSVSFPEPVSTTTLCMALQSKVVRGGQRCQPARLSMQQHKDVALPRRGS